MTKIKDDRYDLSDYWQLGMHDNNGLVTAIAFSYDNNVLFTSGGDGNLFQYQWRGAKSETVTNPGVIPTFQSINDLPDDDAAEDESMLSSEEAKRRKNDDERHTICDAEKKRVRDQLETLRGQFKRIWEMNLSLSESQRLPESDFELDPRITEDLNNTLEQKMKMAQREMEYDVERIQIGVQKMKKHFIDCLDSFPIQVLGIRRQLRVQSIKFRKLQQEFYAAKEELAKKMNLFTEESM